MSRENQEIGIERALHISLTAKVLGEALLAALLDNEQLPDGTFNLERPVRIGTRRNRTVKAAGNEETDDYLGTPRKTRANYSDNTGGGARGGLDPRHHRSDDGN